MDSYARVRGGSGSVGGYARVRGDSGSVGRAAWDAEAGHCTLSRASHL